MSQATYNFIVIGNPIAHSQSPELHQAFARQTGLNINYQRQICPNDSDSFSAVVESFFNGGGTGANVTVPFKETAYTLCENRGALSDFAKAAGAVNTLVIRDGKLYGDNTDGRGLVADLQSKGVSLDGKLDGRKVAILGAGGATRGAILPLLQAGTTLTIFNRTLEKAENLAKQFSPFFTIPNQIMAKTLSKTDMRGQFDVIINATSAGTTGQSLDLAESAITAPVAYDMMYGKDTQFLRHFQNQGARCFDGIGMLINQGALSFALWTGKKVDLEKLGNPFA